MIPPLHNTYSALVDAERTLAHKRAARWALVLEATKRPPLAYDPAGATNNVARRLLRNLVGRAGFGRAIRREGALGRSA
jgi:hypothetical protein